MLPTCALVVRVRVRVRVGVRLSVRVGVRVRVRVRVSCCLRVGGVGDAHGCIDCYGWS